MCPLDGQGVWVRGQERTGLVCGPDGGPPVGDGEVLMTWGSRHLSAGRGTYSRREGDILQWDSMAGKMTPGLESEHLLLCLNHPVHQLSNLGPLIGSVSYVSQLEKSQPSRVMYSFLSRSCWIHISSLCQSQRKQCQQPVT